MPVSIRFLGTAAFQITTANGKRILIDPYLDENPVSPVAVADLERVDLLLVTHAAYDHLGDAEAILRRFPDLPLICGADVRGYLMHRGIDGGRLRAIPWGMTVQEAGVRVRNLGMTAVEYGLDEMIGAKVTETRPFEDWGGWGLRAKGRGRYGLVTNTGPALVFTTAGGHEFTVTTERAQEMAGALNSLADARVR